MKRCKTCRSPLQPSGQPFPIATPAMVRALLAALHWNGYAGGIDWCLQHRMTELGLIAEVYKLSEKERWGNKRKYMRALKTAAEATYEESVKIMDEARGFQSGVERKEIRLTPLGHALAERYKKKLTSDAPEEKVSA